MKTGKKDLFKRIFTVWSAFTLLLAGFTPVYGKTSPVAQYQNRKLNYLNTVAHRGAMDMAPEETMASLYAAKKAGYRQIECDVWYTQSKEFFICHDKDIRRFTGKKLPSWKLSSANRKRYPITRGMNVKNYPVQYFLKLQEVLTFCEKNGMCPWLHLKVSKGRTFSGKALEKLNRILKHYHGNKPVVFTSNLALSKRMKKYSWNKGILCIGHSHSKMKKKFSYAKANRCRFFIMPYYKSHKPSGKLVRMSHKHKIKTVFYRLRSKAGVRQVLGLGGDYFLTDKILFE